MERTLIAWNLPNWITICLMAALGYLILAFGSQMLMSVVGGGSTSEGS